MEAVIASFTTISSYVKHLYYIIDPYEECFLSIDDLEALIPYHKQLAMHPDLTPLILIDIPFEPILHVNPRLISRLLQATENELIEMQRGLPTIQESVLIVPLGNFPMVATQLYIMLKNQEKRNIHMVILVYLAQSNEIVSKVDLIKQALQEEDNVPCTCIAVPVLEAIDSLEACQYYQATLENVIDQARINHPDCIIDLALSNGSESMIPATVFAAQKERLAYIYHGLITDKQLDEAITQQTTVQALTNSGLSMEQRNNRLFLRAYEDEGVYTKFNLFKIPTFTV
jgi:hypothetical protein